MTPQEHYNKAVRLIAEASTIPANNDESNPAAALALAEAQVHATLALYRPTAVAARAGHSYTCDECGAEAVTRSDHAEGCSIRIPHPALLTPMPKGHECPACSHSINVHRAHGCDMSKCGCPAPFGRIMPGDPTP